MVRLVLLVLVLVLAACGDRAPSQEPSDEADSAREGSLPDTVRLGVTPPTPFDAAPIVFDTTEPAEPIVEIPPRRPPPTTEPAPPRPPPPPPRGGPSGSCDVRETEGFCFAYTGDGWTPQEAEDHCAAAPNAAFQFGTCPLLGRIATCAFRRASEPDHEIVYTYYEPYDVALAELACPGTFTRLR